MTGPSCSCPGFYTRLMWANGILMQGKRSYKFLQYLVCLERADREKSVLVDMSVSGSLLGTFPVSADCSAPATLQHCSTLT